MLCRTYSLRAILYVQDHDKTSLPSLVPSVSNCQRRTDMGLTNVVIVGHMLRQPIGAAHKSAEMSRTIYRSYLTLCFSFLCAAGQQMTPRSTSLLFTNSYELPSHQHSRAAWLYHRPFHISENAVSASASARPVGLPSNLKRPTWLRRKKGFAEWIIQSCYRDATSLQFIVFVAALSGSDL